MTQPNYPFDCWYVAAISDEIGRTPIARQLLDQPVVLYRTLSGEVVALADRCAHRAYPLSQGRLDGDLLVCRYHGLRYDASGACVRVPSQPSVPYDACVRAYPLREVPPLVWIWLGDPRRSILAPVPQLPWLASEEWGWACTSQRVKANYMLLHEHFVDLTHIPEVHPEETPPGLEELPPLDRVQVSETTASYTRTLPPAPLADWEAETTALPRDGTYGRRHHGTFLSPAVLAEGWEIDGGDHGLCEVVRIHVVTPESPTTTHLCLFVARNFALDRPHLGRHLEAAMNEVMRVDVSVVETIEATAGYQHAKDGIRVNADAGVLHVRRIVDSMLASEAGQTTRWFASARKTA